MAPTITVDVGTTSVKMCAFDATGTILSSARVTTPTMRDGIGEIYDTAALESAVRDFCRGLDAHVIDSIERVAFAGVGESGGLVRPDLSLASPMVLWHDQRGARYLQRLTDAQQARLSAITGLPVNANYGLSKVRWAVDHAADAHGAVWLNISEYLAARLTGVRWSEFSLASRTMALDLKSRSWSAEACGLVGLDVRWFPKLRAAADGLPIDDAAAARCGLGNTVMVHVAGHDHMVGSVGATQSPGEMLNSTGTTEGLLVLSDEWDSGPASRDAKLAGGISPAGSDFTLFASIPTGGSAFATLQSMLGFDAASLTETVSRLHRQYLSGEIDLGRVPLILPRFRGSPPPDKDPRALGAVAGLRDDTTRDDIVFGCFLGLVLQFADVLALFPDPPRTIKVIGPVSANPLWLQLKADVLGTRLLASELDEVVSRGAQAIASGPRGEAAAPWRDVSHDHQRHAALTEWIEARRQLWSLLKETS